MARFLVIDDDHTTRQLVTLTLESAGHRVIPVASGSAGLELFAEARPDVIITDLVMPRDSLEQVLELTRRHSTLPVIVISATPDTPNHRETARLLGARCTIGKPFHLEEFLRVVEFVIAGRKPA